MTQLFSFPPRLNANGAFVTREDGDADLFAEELAVLIKTIPGERELVPQYGLSDPTFEGIDVTLLTEAIDLFGPPVRIASVTSTYVSATAQDVVVTFDVADIVPLDQEGF